jgi:PAS domain S-box-containing protein
MTDFSPDSVNPESAGYFERILDVFAHIASGDFSKRIDVSALPHDHVLTKVLCGLDMMMDDLEEAQNSLADIRKNLEQQVDERTSELKRVNENLSEEIEGRKKIEAELRDSEEHYRLLTESAQDFIYILDLEMRITYVNSALIRFFGVPKEQILGRMLREFLPVAEITLRDAKLPDRIGKYNPLAFRNEIRFRGKTLWLSTVLVPLRTSGGSVVSTMGISRDITETMEASETIAANEKFLADVFASIQDGISVLDNDLAIVRVNEKMEQWYAHALPIAGKKCYEVYHGRSEPCRLCPSIVALQTGKAAHELVPLQDKDGRVKGWQDLYSFPIIDKKTGEVKGVIEHVRDVTERKAAEESLRQSEERFRTLAETAGTGIFIVKNAKFFYVNSYIEKGTGYSREELLARNFWEIVHPDFRDLVRERYRTRMRGEAQETEYEFKYVRKDGSEGWVAQSVGLIELEGGPAIIGTLQEISERKRIAEVLEAEKELLAVTMESIGDGVVSIDTEGMVLSINKNAAALACDHAEDAVGRHVDEIMCFLDDAGMEPRPGIIREMIKKHGIRHFERAVMIRTGKDAVRLIELSISPVETENGIKLGMVLVFRDITEKQKLEADLQTARKLESLGVLAGGIAHDFNNILTGIITNLFMAKAKVKADAETFELLAEAEKASFKASKLVKQLITFSKGGTPVMEAFSLKGVIEESAGFCLAGSNVKYMLKIPSDLWLVEADKGQIEQVLNNLIINADQAMPGGGTITVTAQNITLPQDRKGDKGLLSMLPEGRYVKVSVADEGPGIPSENLKKIFDPYFSTKPNGTGLGLTIAYSIVKNHKGTITVDSQKGEGAVFSFHLPAARDEEKASPKSSRGALAAPAPLRVLVMDDDAAVRTVVTQLLKTSGYTVSCASTGEETIALYERAMASRAPYDVVVMDLTIPGGMGGKETVAKLLAIDPKAKVIVSSGYSSDPIMANYRDYGFCGVIAKPFNIGDFLSVIRKSAGGKSAKRATGRKKEK